jgi:triacylglycerol lipase
MSQISAQNLSMTMARRAVCGHGHALEKYFKPLMRRHMADDAPPLARQMIRCPGVNASIPSPAASPRTVALPPIVLVHGIFRDHRIMRHLAKAFVAAGRRVLSPDLRPCNGSVPIAALAGQLAEFLEHNLSADERCDIVGHSLGGLVARAYVQRGGGRARVRRLVTLASPHHGSLLAWLLPGRGSRDLRPGSPFLRDLARDVHHLDGVHVASYWTPFDLIVVPPRSAQLPVGRDCRRLLPHHRAFITDARFAKELIEALAAERPGEG